MPETMYIEQEILCDKHRKSPKIANQVKFKPIITLNRTYREVKNLFTTRQK